MNDPPLACVVDANVALKLFFEQSGSDQTDALFAHLEANTRSRFYVPDFFYAECASALANYARLTDYTPKQARQDMAELLALALHVRSTADLAAEALDIALASGISGYDAFYVALSHRVNAPFVTADEKLVRALSGKPYRVQSLSAFDIPPLS
ncbi:type II toxin-antitoxin system VapC family toxin [Candidatus Acetothermia bacterium]|nr:type II toxin-antitoxin system VapC family toxin [Candidatus Acetothermia bacterium]MBI3460002.1 type II toxin-antitoxin system VapC family toxin [Candidatus Acetothermia bacterium]MBI3660607.1 type II toxin-antitoxin system VapC family toxin [Candidatus Acetothermia bacterium]